MSKSEESSQLGAEVRMRWKSGTGSLVFYMGRGESRRGLKACEKSAQLRALVEEVFAMATEIPEEQF